MTTFPRLGTSLMALLGIGGLAACAPMSKTAPSEEIVALIKTSPQPAGVVIEVDEATIPVDGWMVIHATRDGKPVVPDSIGHTRIPKGTSRNIRVPLTEAVKPGDTVITMLHADTDTIGVYEFRTGSVDKDLPVTLNGAVVVAPLSIK